MELCDDDPEHSYQVATLALQLADALGDRLGLDGDDVELLHAGALLANVGLFISHSGHHKHSYYVIRNSEHLTGFTDREIELIAQVARYHRKGRPADKHPEFAALSSEDQDRVRAMVCLLRVAIGLDRNHDGAVERVDVTTGFTDGTGSTDDGAERVRLTLLGAPDEDLSLEVYAAAERSNMLADQLGATVEVVAAG